MKLLYFLVVLYTLPSMALQISPPAKWQEQLPPPEGITKQFISPSPQGGFSSNLNITQRKPDSAILSLKTPQEIATRLEKAQMRIFPMFKVLAKKELQAGKIRGALLSMSYAYGPLDLAAYQFVFLHKGEFVTVVYTCLLSQLDALKPEFEKSLATLKLDPQHQTCASQAGAHGSSCVEAGGNWKLKSAPATSPGLCIQDGLDINRGDGYGGFIDSYAENTQIQVRLLTAHWSCNWQPVQFDLNASMGGLFYMMAMVALQKYLYVNMQFMLAMGASAPGVTGNIGQKLGHQAFSGVVSSIGQNIAANKPPFFLGQPWPWTGESSGWHGL